MRADLIKALLQRLGSKADLDDAFAPRAEVHGALYIVNAVIDLREDPLNGNGLIVRAIAGISLKRAIADAIKGYGHPEALTIARRSAMMKDSSWEIPVDVYESLFRRLLRSERP